jgi:hypothetical protein
MGQTNRVMDASKGAAQGLAFENGREAVFLFQPYHGCHGGVD